MSRLACPRCKSALQRVHRERFLERFLGALFPLIRPFHCSACGFRGLRLAIHRDGKALLRVALVLVLGLILVQLLWYVRTRAPEHPGGGYQPRDLERQHYLEDGSRR